jgi:hypothetical protein
MQSQRRQRLYAYVTIGLAVLMAASAIFPSLIQNIPQQAQTVDPTEVPIPTFAPPPDLSTISFDQRYLHPSGLFTVAQPTGWLPSRDSNNGTFVQINFNNDAAKSVIEAYIEYPSETIETLEQLNAHFTTDDLESSWSQYTGRTETGRFIDEENERVLIDFELTLGRQIYVARHVARLRDGQVHVTRVVTPENALDLLRYLVEQMPPTIEPVALFESLPIQQIEWSAYFSGQDGLIIRYPSAWNIVDGGQGGPVSVEGQNGEVLRVETLAGQSIADEDAASAYVAGLRPDIEVVSVVPVTRNGAEGFAVAYQFTTLEGENQNGLAVLLNGSDETLYVANVRAPGEPADLNALGDDAAFIPSNLAGIAASFNLTQGLDLPIAGDPAATG